MPTSPRKTVRGSASASDDAVAELAEQIRLLTQQLAALPPAGVVGPPGTSPPGEQTGSEDVPDGDEPRRVAHELLGQSHAVFLLALRPDVLPLWCPPDLLPSVVQTSADIVAAVGEAQISVASGRYDDELMAAGLGGPASRPKRKGLRFALQRLVDVLTGDAVADRLPWLRGATGWAKSAVESFPKLIPGAEKVKEALEIVLNGIDTIQAMRPPNRPPAR
jgi:hypothetical protein